MNKKLLFAVIVSALMILAAAPGVMGAGYYVIEGGACKYVWTTGYNCIQPFGSTVVTTCCTLNNTCETKCNVAAGAACTRTQQCASGLTCCNLYCESLCNVPIGGACTRTTQCVPGLVCSGGFCKVPSGGSCTASSQCISGTLCCSSTNLCQATCPAGSSCTLTSQCNTGLTCCTETSQTCQDGCPASGCNFTESGGATSGTLYGAYYLCNSGAYTSGTCSYLKETNQGNANGSNNWTDTSLTGLTSKCRSGVEKDMELWYQVSTISGFLSAPLDGYCTKFSHTVNWDSSPSLYCNEGCVGHQVAPVISGTWGTLSCCGDDATAIPPQDCSIIEGSRTTGGEFICIQESGNWVWKPATSLSLGDIRRVGCVTSSPAYYVKGGTSFLRCSLAKNDFSVSKTQVITSGFATHSYLCPTSSLGLWECARDTASKFTTTETSQVKTLGSFYTITGVETYYCLIDGVGTNNTKWVTSSQVLCTSPGIVTGVSDCCVEDGSLEPLGLGSPMPYNDSSGNCYASINTSDPNHDGCFNDGWHYNTYQYIPGTTCFLEGQNSTDLCYRENQTTSCTTAGWLCAGGNPQSYSGLPVGSQCKVAGDVDPLNSSYCWLASQNRVCQASTGWSCSGGVNQTKYNLPTTVGGDCYYGLNTSVDLDACRASTGWHYTVDSTKDTCYGSGTIANGNCYGGIKTDNCTLSKGWTCANGTEYLPSAKPATCLHHTGVCPGKDCLLHKNCTAENCTSSGWACFNSPSDSSCGVNCYDRDNNGICDCKITSAPANVTKGTWNCDVGTDIKNNPGIDRDGDGIINSYSSDFENNVVDATTGTNDCDDGFDNDGDNTCDNYGCLCSSANHFCGTWDNLKDGLNLPKDGDCGSTCATCSVCGTGAFNICDQVECLSTCTGSGACYFKLGVPSLCCIDTDVDTYCEDSQSPIDDCDGVKNIYPLVTDDRIDNDGDSRKDCNDTYLSCNSNFVCEQNIGPGVVDESCACPDCNLTNPPAGMCLSDEVCINWTCGDYDDSAFRCEFSNPDAVQGNCTLNEDSDCWDYLREYPPYIPCPMCIPPAPQPACCGDDGGSADTWINELDQKNRTGCSSGDYCAENIITGSTGTHLGCCPRATDVVDLSGNCIPASAYIKPALTDGTSAEGSVSGALSSGVIYPYNQTVTLSINGTKVFAVSGYFSSLAKKMLYGDVDSSGAVDSSDSNDVSLIAGSSSPMPVKGNLKFIAADADGNGAIESADAGSISAKAASGTKLPVETIPAGRFVPEGYIDLAALHIEQKSGFSVYVNATGIKNEIARNRISNQYTVFLENTNNGDGLIVCLDPEQGQGSYGSACSVDVEFRSAGSKLGFSVSATADYYEITTAFDQHDDWYAFTSVTPDLIIYDDSDIRTDIVSFENVGFYAKLTTQNAFIEDALCRITWLDTNETVTMQNISSEGYYYANRTYTARGSYKWEVSCSHSVYQPVAGTDTALIKPNAELVISDVTDLDSETRFIGEFVDFRAVYREAKGNQSIILGADCNITYHDGTFEEMDYDNEGYYTESRNYSNYGSFSYTVRCSKTGYDLLAEVDTVDIFPKSCSRSAMDENTLVPGSAKFNVISKRGFVLLEKVTE